MKTTISSISIALCLALGVSTPALADRGHHRDGHRAYYVPAPAHTMGISAITVGPFRRPYSPSPASPPALRRRTTTRRKLFMSRRDRLRSSRPSRSIRPRQPVTGIIAGRPASITPTSATAPKAGNRFRHV